MRIPGHITIIMDGNGRWARKQGMERLFGHRAGADSVRACCEYAVEHGIRYLSLFAFSEENWNRPKDEIDGLMELMIKSVVEEKPVFERNNIRFRVIGDRKALPVSVREHIEDCEAFTAANTGLQLIVFLSYSGKWDIVQAVNRFISENGADGKVPHMEYSDMEKYLSTSGIPEPDLMIRTSGEQRISNYMLWQCAYTEFYFTPVLWPDFRKEDLQAAVEEYGRRERRYGKTGDQLNNEASECL